MVSKKYYFASKAYLSSTFAMQINHLLQTCQSYVQKLRNKCSKVHIRKLDLQYSVQFSLKSTFILKNHTTNINKKFIFNKSLLSLILQIQQLLPFLQPPVNTLVTDFTSPKNLTNDLLILNSLIINKSLVHRRCDQQEKLSCSHL